MLFAEHHLLRLREIVLDYAGVMLERLSVRRIDSKVARHMSELAIVSPEDYLFLLSDNSGRWALDQLMAKITVNESFFFRNPGQFRYLAHQFLPEFYARCTQPSVQNPIQSVSQHSAQSSAPTSGAPHLTLLSAGCAGGEETYSLAAVIQWFQRSHPDMTISLTGIDLSSLNIECANAGVYRVGSFHSQSREFIEEFQLPFPVPLVGSFQVPAPLRQMAAFQLLNLKDEYRLKRFIGSDIIMCRNVLIYFTDKFRKQLTKLFWQLLNPGGMLFLGETESLHIQGEEFELVPCCGAYGYRKVVSEQI